MEDIFELILELESELTGGKGIFKKVDTERCSALVNRMKDSYPKVIDDAQYILTHNKEILTDAERRADKIITDAQRRIESASSQSEVARRAEQLAARHYDNTRISCEAAINKSAQIIYDMFEDAEGYITNLLNILRRNREELLGEIRYNNKMD